MDAQWTTDCWWLCVHIGRGAGRPGFHQDFVQPSPSFDTNGSFYVDFSFRLQPQNGNIPILFAWVYSCKASIRDNCAVTIVEPVNGSMLMRMTVYANSCTPTLGREHPIGTRAIAVIGSFLLKRPLGEKNIFVWQHPTTLHYTKLHYTTLHYTTIHSTTLHHTTLHYTEWHCTTDRQVDR